MKNFGLFLTATLLSGAFALGAGPALGAEGIILKVPLPGSNYCHLKFPAIRRDTLYSDRPVLADPSSGNIVDFYGPCDHDPLGKEEIQRQRDDRSRARRREWGDN